MEKVIELNTSSRAYHLKSLMPSREILELYHDMGGKIITIGSDAHNADRVGDRVMESQKILKEIGFNGIYTFDQMKPNFMNLNFRNRDRKTLGPMIIWTSVLYYIFILR